MTLTQAGFVDFPSGRFRNDPSAPKGGDVPYFYSHPAHRWIQMLNYLGYELMSSDETEMVELRPATGKVDVYAMNLVTRVPRHVGVLPVRLGVVGVEAGSLYVITDYLVRMDLHTGQTTQIGAKAGSDWGTVNGHWHWITSAAAWSSLIALPNQGDANPVESMSLVDGAVATWYTSPAGRSVSIVGFVGPAEPLVAEYDTEPYDNFYNLRYMLLTAPGSAKTIKFDTATDPRLAITDKMGIWLFGPGRVWLYSESRLIPMADLTSGPVGSERPYGAGRCA